MNNVKHRINQHIVKVSFKSAVVGVKRGWRVMLGGWLLPNMGASYHKCVVL